MADKKILDTRIPQALTNDALTQIKDLLAAMPTLTNPLVSISADETKYFKKLSKDDRQYISDVITEMEMNNGRIATNGNVNNIKQAKLVGEQCRELHKYLTYWANIFERCAQHAESFSYQHAAVFEDDIDNAIKSNVKGSMEMKERLKVNREARNAAAAATRKANAKQETKQEGESVNN